MARTSIGTPQQRVALPPRRGPARGAVVAVLAVLTLGLAGCGDPDGGGGGGGYVAADLPPQPWAR